MSCTLLSPRHLVPSGGADVGHELPSVIDRFRAILGQSRRELMTSPQEKKRLSYAKDRRNTYGENSKASRKGIPLAKARANRAERHAQDNLLSSAVAVDGAEALAEVELTVRSVEPRKWRKSPDKPLGQVLARRAARKKPGS